MHAAKITNMERETFDFSKSGDITTMPSNFYWRPVCDNNEPINKQLKWILSEEERIDSPLSTKDLEFLKGLRAAGIQDADKLIDAIERFGYIELYEIG